MTTEDEGAPPLAAVLDLAALRDDGLAPIRTRDPAFGGCDHQNIVVDMKNGHIECGKCGTRLEPFVAVKMLAERGDHFRRMVKNARWETENEERKRDVARRELLLLRSRKQKAKTAADEMGAALVVVLHPDADGRIGVSARTAGDEWSLSFSTAEVADGVQNAITRWLASRETGRAPAGAKG